MSQPTVAAVMLVSGREAMVRKAVECVRAQTYGSLRLVVLDTGEMQSPPRGISECAYSWRHVDALRRASIGALRNYANSIVGDADIIAHFDSDDLSNPNRIAEQVALLQASGTDAVGYNECLFWREAEPGWESGHGYVGESTFRPGEAWLYTNTSRAYAIGASLCYWRKAWEQHPFPDAPKNSQASGEDTLWLREVTCTAVSAFRDLKPIGPTLDLTPRMVCRVHGANTMKYELAGNSWKRMPEQDAWCRGRMAL